MVGAMIIVIIKGTMDVGGLSVVIERNSLGQRFDKPEYDPIQFQALLIVLNVILFVALTWIPPKGTLFGTCS